MLVLKKLSILNYKISTKTSVIEPAEIVQLSLSICQNFWQNIEIPTFQTFEPVHIQNGKLFKVDSVSLFLDFHATPHIDRAEIVFIHAMHSSVELVR